MLFLEFVAIPKNQKKLNNNLTFASDYNEENILTKQYAKPSNFKSIFKLFLSYF